MNKPSISNDLELAEKALEVMGWEFMRRHVTESFYVKDGTEFYLDRFNPLSNDLAAEGKRWLLSQFASPFLTIVVLPDEASVCIYSGEDEVIREESRKKYPTENEAVLRAVVEIGKKESGNDGSQ